MTSAALLSLLYKVNARRFRGRANPIGLVSHHNIDVLGSNHLARSRDDMHQQRLATDFMQHLGPLRLEPRALAGRHNHNGRGGLSTFLLAFHVHSWLTLAWLILAFRGCPPGSAA